MSEVEVYNKSWKKIQEENGKLKKVIEKMANEIFIEYTPHFASPEAVIDFFMNTEKTRYCSASVEQRATCQEEKMGCTGCNYYRKEINYGNKGVSA